MIYKVKGDCTNPIKASNTNNIICHCVNDLGIFGSGVIMAIDKKWKGPMKNYKNWHREGSYNWKNRSIPFKQGQCQLIKVDVNLYVANLIAQSGVGYFHNLPAVRYGALEESLLRLKHECLPKLEHKETILHLPEICCGRAGGDWDTVESILNRVFDLDMYLYEYDGVHK